MNTQQVWAVDIQNLRPTDRLVCTVRLFSRLINGYVSVIGFTIYAAPRDSLILSHSPPGDLPILRQSVDVCVTQVDHRPGGVNPRYPTDLR